MRKKTTKIITVAIAAILATATLTACSGTSTKQVEAEQVPQETEVVEPTQAPVEEEQPAAEEAADTLSGSISMAGSTSMEKLANAVAESFMTVHPGVTVTAEFTGSSAGIEAVTAGSVDIGNSSRNLKDSETAAGAVENIVAIDGIAVVADPNCSIEGLTKDQLVDIYTGKIKNWSEVGGEDGAIVVVGREAGSGTRGAFEELLGIEDLCVYANELDSTGTVMAKVASTQGAIGYVSLDVVDDTVKAMSLDEVAPTVENIKAGTYLLSRPFVMATKGEIAEQSEAVQELFKYLESDEGKEVITSVGLITVD